MANEHIPARIIQIRDGVLNTLSEFEVEVARSSPNEEGTVDHRVSTYSIISGLSEALQAEVRHLRRDTTVPEEAEQWLESMKVWIFHDDTDTRAL